MAGEFITGGSKAWLEIDRFRSRPDGKSEFVRVRMPEGESRALVDHGGNKTAFMSAAFTAPDVRLVLLPEGLDQPPHPAPQPQIVVILKGRIEVRTTGDGAVKSWGPGGMVIASDHDGGGHYTRVLEGPALVMFVPLGSADLDAWTIPG